MKKINKVIKSAAFFACSSLFFNSCLTVNAKKIVEAPYVPETVASSEKIEVEELAKIYYSSESFINIDGNFDEWKNLDGVHTRQMVYGGSFDSSNADGLFKCASDGINLYVFADIKDNDAGVNNYEPSQAWRGDSVEFFFGTETGKHTTYKDSDVRVRIIPRSRENKFDVGIGINDSEVNSSDIKACCIYNDSGYIIESIFPLSLLGGKNLKLNQKIKMDFQINDADNGKERTGLLHWNSPYDNTYADPSSWGNAKVITSAANEDK